MGKGESSKHEKRRHVAAPVVIGDLSELAAFADSPAFRSRRPLLLAIAAMPQSEAFARAERLNRDRGECGCSLGAKAMTGAFALTLLLLVLQYGLLSGQMLVRAPLALLAAFAGALLGKASGIALGRRRARREVTRILTDYKAIS